MSYKLEDVEYKLMPKTILFFEKTPFMGVELLNLLVNNYRLVSYFEDGNFNNLNESGYPIDTFKNTDLVTSIDSDKSVVAMLSDLDFIKKLTESVDSDNLALFFHVSSEMDNALRKTKIRMALPSYEIQEKIGNKIFLNGICSKLGIEVNKSLIIEKTKKTASKIYGICLEELGSPFIVQGGLGVSGEDTFEIASEQELANHLPKLGNRFKASKFLNSNIPLSVHICITKNKIDYEGPYLQIIGFRELAKNPFQFSGNDTNQKIFNEEVKKNIFELSMKLSEYAKSEGYRGIMGIDFLWDKKTGKVLVQEINSRLVGLTRLLTGIQKEQKIIPHLIKHINEFNPIDYDSSLSEKSVDLSKHNYSQIYISHNDDSELTIKKYLPPGIYKIVKNRLMRTRNSLFVSDMEENDVLISYSAYEGMKLHADQIISKIILKKSALQENKYELNQELIDQVKILKREVS